MWIAIILVECIVFGAVGFVIGLIGVGIYLLMRGLVRRLRRHYRARKRTMGCRPGSPSFLPANDDGVTP
jgi:hypothetical protein